MKPVHLQLKTITLGFACQCAAGFTGLTCMETVDPCASAPCQNGATCRSTGNQVKHGALNIIFFLFKKIIKIKFRLKNCRHRSRFHPKYLNLCFYFQLNF